MSPCSPSLQYMFFYIHTLIDLSSSYSISIIVADVKRKTLQVISMETRIRWSEFSFTVHPQRSPSYIFMVQLYYWVPSNSSPVFVHKHKDFILQQYLAVCSCCHKCNPMPTSCNHLFRIWIITKPHKSVTSFHYKSFTPILLILF